MKRLRFILIYTACLLAVAIATTILYHKTQKADIYYYLGRRHFLSNEYEEAIRLYDKSLSYKPQRKDVLEDLAYCYLWNGQPEQATNIFKILLSLESTNPDAQKNLAQLLSWQGNYKEALSMLQSLLNDPNFKDKTEIKKIMAQAYLWDGQYEKAQEILKKVIEDNPSDNSAKLILAKARHYSGKTKEAIQIYEEVAKDLGEKEDVKKEVKELLGEAYMIEKDYDQALVKYREILKNDPSNIKVRIMLANVLSWQKEYDAAILEYKKILEIEPERKDIEYKLAEVYTYQKEYEKAETHLKNVINTDPSNIQAHQLLVDILTWQDRFDEALSYAEKVIEIADDTTSNLQYGKLLLYSNQYERAQEFFEKVIGKEPENREAIELLADLFSYQKEYRRAIDLYKSLLGGSSERAIKVKIADVLSWDKQYEEALGYYQELIRESFDKEISLKMARVFSWAKQYKNSISTYQKILEQEYDPAIELELKAKQAFWDGRFLRARPLYAQLKEKEPENLEALFDLAQIHSYLSAWDDAKRIYNEILHLSPNHYRARKALNKVILLSSRPSWEVSLESFEADSAERANDINRKFILNEFRLPIDNQKTINVSYAVGKRYFSDFADTTEHVGKIGFVANYASYGESEIFYQLTQDNHGIGDFHGFGLLGFIRFSDWITNQYSFTRKRLENNSSVIQEKYYQDKFFERIESKVNKRLEVGVDYYRSLYSDNNQEYEAGIDTLWYFSLDPQRLSLKHRFFFKDFDKEVAEYFSPQNFWTNQLTLNWRQYLNKEEIFFGADDIYYDFQYILSVDSENVVGHAFVLEGVYEAIENWDINVRLSTSQTSNTVYRDHLLSLSAKHYF